MKEILFVCSGNTCRSPMAEGIAKQLLSKRFPFPVRITSAGSSALEGLPASSDAVEVARQHDIDLTDHRSRLLNATMVRGADLIVAMAEKHRNTVGVIEPESLAYTYKLTEFSERVSGDIADPLGGDLDTYRRAFDVIKECVEGMAEKLQTPDRWRNTDGPGARRRSE